MDEADVIISPGLRHRHGKFALEILLRDLVRLLLGDPEEVIGGRAGPTVVEIKLDLGLCGRIYCNDVCSLALHGRQENIPVFAMIFNDRFAGCRVLCDYFPAVRHENRHGPRIEPEPVDIFCHSGCGGRRGQRNWTKSR